MSYLQPRAFASSENFYNITRNFAFIGIMSVGMVTVIVTGGIDLSVGSIMGLVGVVCGVHPAGRAALVRRHRRRAAARACCAARSTAR